MMRKFFNLIEQKKQLQAKYDALHTAYIEEIQFEADEETARRALASLETCRGELHAVQSQLQTIREAQNAATLKEWRRVYHGGVAYV